MSNIQQITLTFTSAEGVVTQKTFSKKTGKPMQLKVPKGTKVDIQIQGAIPVKETAQAAAESQPNQLHLKQVGNHLVVETDGEALFQLSDFYATPQVSVGSIDWSYAEPTTLVNAEASTTLEAEAISQTETAAHDAAKQDKFFMGFNMPAFLAATTGAVALASSGSGAAATLDNVINGVFAAGPAVAGHNLWVKAFDSNGNLLGEPAKVEAGSGKFSINVRGYKGSVVLQVVNTGTDPDYRDEATGLGVDLGGDFFAYGITNGGTVTININPLTTVAAQLAGIKPNSTTGEKPDLTLFDATKKTNTQVATEFGLTGDITQLDFVSAIKEDGTPQTPNDLGAVLAALSGWDQTNGSPQTTITKLVNELNAGNLQDTTKAALVISSMLAQSNLAGGNPILVKSVSNLLMNKTATSGYAIDPITGDDIVSASEFNAFAAGVTAFTFKVPAGTSPADLSLNINGGTNGANTFTVNGTVATYVIDATDVNTLQRLNDGSYTVQLMFKGAKVAERYFVVDAQDNPATGLTLLNTITAINENTSISGGKKVADIFVIDPDGGSGYNIQPSDSNNFFVKQNTATNKYELWLKDGVVLNYENSGVNHQLSTTLTLGSATVAYTLAINNINEAPVGANAPIAINEDNSKVFAVSDFGFADAAGETDALKAVIITSLPTAGSLKLNGVAVVANQSIAVADIIAGKLIYTPAANGNGNNYATFDFKLQDDGGTTNGGADTSVSANTITFNVSAVNDAPINTLPAAFSANEDVSTAITGLSIADVDAASSTITVTLTVTKGTLTIANNIQNGLAISGIANNGTANVTLTGTLAAINATLAASNGVLYQGNANYNGADTLTMLTSDGGNTGSGGTRTDSDTLNITVNAVNDTPTSSVSAGTTTVAKSATFGQSYSYNAQTTLQFADVEDTTLTWSLVGAPSWMSVSSTGLITGTAPALGSPGAPAAGSSYTFKVRATDSSNAYVERDVSVTIYNNPQVISITRATTNVADSSGNTATSGAVDFLITFNKTDVLNVDETDFVVAFTPRGGSAANLTAGTDYTLTQVSGSADKYTLSVSASKVASFTQDGTLSVAAIAAGSNIKDSADNNISTTLPTGANYQSYVFDRVNEAPVFSSSTVTATAIGENTSRSTVVFTAAATDPDFTAPNKTITYSLGGTDGGKFDINSSGQVTLKSGNSYDYETQTSYSFIVTATDGATPALTATQTVSLAINNVNEAPVLANGYNDQLTIARNVVQNNTDMQNDFTDPDGVGALGAPKLSYSLASGTMPTGLTLNADGSITGTTTAAAGDYTVRVRVTDHGVTGDTASKTLEHDYTLHLVDAPALASNQVLDNVNNLDVRSSLVLAFNQNITLGSGHITIYDDMGTSGWVHTNTATGETVTDVSNNTVDITLTNGVVASVKINSVDYSGRFDLTNSVIVNGSNLVIDLKELVKSGPGTVAGGSTAFDWDFGSDYHINFDAGIVKSSANASLTNAALTDATTLNFTTVTPANNTVGTLSQMMDSTGASTSLSNSSYWINGNQSSNDGAHNKVVMDLSSHDVAVVLDSNGSNSTTGGLQTFIQLNSFGLGDNLYLDNHGNMSLATTNGLAIAASWGSGTYRNIGDAGAAGGTGQVYLYKDAGVTTFSPVVNDSFFEAAGKITTVAYDAIIFG